MADAVVVLLPLVFISLAAVGVEQVAAVAGQDDAALVLTDRHEPDQAFVLGVLQCVATTVGIVESLQISLGDHAKGAGRRQGETVLTIQFVEVLPGVLHQLALRIAGQLQTLGERVARVVALRLTLTLDVALTVILVAGSSSQRAS